MVFSVDARRYLAAGFAPMALPKGEKDPPPTGFTGRSGKCADAAQLDAWAKSYGEDANLACWFGREITIDGVVYLLVGIDVDHYDAKRGGDQLQSLVEKLGPLSDKAPWISSSRVDGISGIRWFLMPLHDTVGNRIELSGKADQAIEVIQRHHRYAAVWPSTNPKSGGTMYWWFPPGTELTNEGRNLWRDTDDLPDPKTFPVLSPSWVDFLRDHRSHSEEIDLTTGVDELHQWTEIFNAGQIEDACKNVANALTTWKRKISEEESSHDKITDAHWMLYRLAAEGHTGWLWAITEVESHWAASVLRSGKRTPSEVRGEIARSKNQALRKIKVRVDRDGVKAECDCAQSTPVATQGNSMESVSGRNVPLDLRELRTTPPRPISWLLPDVIARDSYVSMSAAPGTGKSVLTRAIAVEASLGRSAFDPATELDPARVIYLDAENGQDWWRDGLESMGAPLDLPNLKVICYPDLAGLDTPKGAKEFLALIAKTAAELDDCVDLVVFDTVSRFIEGGENDADTWSQFYRLAIQPLRDQKIAVLRLDHLGKDADRGPRGSSHKLSDVDADFRMTAAKAGSDDLTLTLGKRRRQHFAQTLTVTRKDGPLRHELHTSPASFIVRTADGTVVSLDPDTNALVADLDQLNVSDEFGRDKARKTYIQAGGSIAARDVVWAAAVRFRKERAKDGNQP